MLQRTECFKQLITLIKINCQDEGKKTGYLNVLKIAVCGLRSQSVRDRSALPFGSRCMLELPDAAGPRETSGPEEWLQLYTHLRLWDCPVSGCQARHEGLQVTKKEKTPSFLLVYAVSLAYTSRSSWLFWMEVWSRAENWSWATYCFIMSFRPMDVWGHKI